MNISDWNKDFKPAKFPTTEEERVAAAKKYNLLPEDYKPYPDDGTGYGDYPHLPDVPVETKDPYYPYDSPELKRNFGEPVTFVFYITKLRSRKVHFFFASPNRFMLK